VTQTYRHDIGLLYTVIACSKLSHHE